jgi:large subunit ribosomal protein L29
MKVKEIRELSMEELKDKERKLVEELFNLRFRHATGQLDTPSSVKLARKNIARVKTVLREREEQE